MEDISRELEREIAQIKPAPHKMRKENSILIINDFGEMRSGAFLKVFVYFFLVISLIGGLGTVVFYRLYSKVNNQNIQLKNSQDVFEKKVDRLTSEKEILMARLVVTGNAVELEALTRHGKIGQDPPKQEQRSGMKGKLDGAEFLPTGTTPDSKIGKGDRVGLDDNNSASSPAQSGERADQSVEQFPDALSNVSIGSFSLSSGRDAHELIVRFNVRNTTENSKEISGRIFWVLRPKGATPDKWVVIPKSSIMKNGVPGPYKQGHYFSISRFKPIQLTINTKTPLQDFSDASVFIFDETEKLLFKTTFDIEKNKHD
ncbi:hypothetical protein DO021_10945 [Desulfobacter hydrogenophilus]|uniref:Uncharacterized protein n=1 Tax=Desulfobacter hydrogenophilus TaxID=2291 RepID=A0A328FEU3_9BACT|nr:hypothetical protein [Desulfobacter hydrogenophilus]NDY72030.1 hypothetical protein [Desulfobacter hydrogenophilus]QBH11453.1 hypothetical protein EYB58_00050 [Desulfobacter hydrogenophilus]RAM01952.1 hypothetical protein DO021_10945 [Desulfobacter hydrogenophilus]